MSSEQLFTIGGPGGPGRPKGSRNKERHWARQLHSEHGREALQRVVDNMRDADRRVSQRASEFILMQGPRIQEEPILIELPEINSLADAKRAVTEGWCDLFNIRLSKCGGVVSALRILAEARRGGLGAWLGCMVGESPLLSAAGRAFAGIVEGLRHVEGAFDRHLFREHLALPPVGFGRGGAGTPLDGPGLGPEMQPGLLMRWTTQWDTFNLRP